jgi:hypothetical protein
MNFRRDSLVVKWEPSSSMLSSNLSVAMILVLSRVFQYQNASTFINAGWKGKNICYNVTHKNSYRTIGVASVQKKRLVNG